MQSIAGHETVKGCSKEFSGTLPLQTAILTENISTKDRRLLLAASLRLFLRRLDHGISVRRDDLLRLADFADR